MINAHKKPKIRQSTLKVSENRCSEICLHTLELNS